MPISPAWVLTGPTASGKTALSLRLAQKYGCEIVCMDSMQLYRGMDIGTAKATAEERALVPHHMLDILEPWESYSVTRYVEDAAACCEGIRARGHIPLFVGGTGFYLRAMRHPMAMGDTAGDPALRAELEIQAAAPGGKEALHEALAALDPVTAARLHVNDTRRVIRALEVCRLTGRPFSQQTPTEGKPPIPCRVAALTMPRETLYRRIDLRVEQMIADGLMDELRALLARGVPESCQAMQAIGYKELLPVLRGERPLEEAVALIQQGTRRYAKRQMTWMRREEDVCWVHPLDADALEQLERFFLGEADGSASIH